MPIICDPIFGRYLQIFNATEGCPLRMHEAQNLNYGMLFRVR